MEALPQTCFIFASHVVIPVSTAEMTGTTKQQACAALHYISSCCDTYLQCGRSSELTFAHEVLCLHDLDNRPADAH